MKRTTFIFLAIVLIALVIYVGYWYMYKRSMDEVSRNWYEQEYVKKEINGVLKSITEFNNNPFKIVLGIQNEQDEFEITYGTTCVDSIFRGFVKEGDLVYKESGSKKIQFCKKKSNDQCKKFELNFCGKFE